MSILKKLSSMSMIVRTLISLFLGALPGLFFPKQEWICIPGGLFVDALKPAAPLRQARSVVPSWGEAKGRTEGGIEGSIRTLWGLVNDHLIDINVASARAHMSVSEFEEKSKALMAEEPAEYKP